MDYLFASMYIRGTEWYNPEKHSNILCGIRMSTQGGARRGAGRPKGRLATVTEKAREAAMETGMLPHQWLLMVARGELVPHKRWKIVYDKQGNEKSRELIEEEFYADFPTRIDAAKAAAPFYAPKLAIQTVSVTGGSTDAVTEALKDIAEKLPV